MKTKYEDLEIYQISEELSERIWNLVIKWDYFEKDTIGKQIVKSADSIGANIAESSGRGSYPDYKRFMKISRGSLFELKHWVKKSFIRNLFLAEDYKELTAAIEELIPRLSAFINYLNKMCK